MWADFVAMTALTISNAFNREGPTHDEREQEYIRTIKQYSKPEQEWHQMNGTYFSVDNAGYASGKAEWWSNVYDQQMYANIPAPRAEIADSYKLEDAAKKATFDKVHNPDGESTPNITWSGTMMWATNGAPNVSVSLSSTEWGGCRNP